MNDVTNGIGFSRLTRARGSPEDAVFITHGVMDVKGGSVLPCVGETVAVLVRSCGR